MPRTRYVPTRQARSTIPGHDPLVMRRYPPPKPELEGLVVRLDVMPKSWPTATAHILRPSPLFSLFFAANFQQKVHSSCDADPLPNDAHRGTI